MAFAELLNKKLGRCRRWVDIIQFRAAFNVYMQTLRLGVAARRSLHGALTCTTAFNLLRLWHQGQCGLKQNARRPMAPFMSRFSALAKAASSS